MPNQVEYRTIRNTSDLERFAPQWHTLWHEDPFATPFQAPEWLIPWWHQFGQPDLRATVILQNGEAIGFLPFYVYRAPDTGERQLLLLGVGTTDYLDGIFSPRCAIDHVGRAMEIIFADDEWDRMVASQLRPESLLLKALDQSADAKLFAAEGCSRIAAAPIKAMPKHIRRNVRYYRNCAVREGNLELVTSNDSNWAELFHDLQQLHAECWRQRGQDGVLADEQVLAWHREAIPRLVQVQMVRLYSLRLDGEAIAAIYMLTDPPHRSPRTQYLYLAGYSTRYAALSPGTLLLAFAVDRAAEQNVGTVDLLRGEEAYKHFWHSERVPTYGCTFLHSSTPTAANCVYRAAK